MSEDGFDKTQVVVFLVVVAIAATIGISVFSEVGDISESDLEDAENQTADPYKGPDYNPYRFSPLQMAAFGVMTFGVVGDLVEEGFDVCPECLPDQHERYTDD